MEKELNITKGFLQQADSQFFVVLIGDFSVLKGVDGSRVDLLSLIVSNFVNEFSLFHTNVHTNHFDSP